MGRHWIVSVLFNEPKLLKLLHSTLPLYTLLSFSALQRAEIAEIKIGQHILKTILVSVLFNEPKLLKCASELRTRRNAIRFSALQRAEIAEMVRSRAATRLR